MITSYEKCDQTPLDAKMPALDPSEGPFKLVVDNKGIAGKYLPDQTYIGKSHIT